jgi:hypothetical protein
VGKKRLIIFLFVVDSGNNFRYIAVNTNNKGEITKMENLIEKIKNDEEITFETELTGTEKQIKYAQNVRVELLEDLVDDIKYEAIENGYGFEDEDVKSYIEKLDILLNTESACEIIEYTSSNGIRKIELSK